jgi:ethanolamine utilization protein EutN
MKFGRVIGTVVATKKYEGLEGVKLLVVQPLTRELEPNGRPTIAADATAQAGPGELVFMVASREGAQAMPELFVPVDLAITGIVDEVEVEHGPRRDQPTAVWHLPKKKPTTKKKTRKKTKKKGS